MSGFLARFRWGFWLGIVLFLGILILPVRGEFTVLERNMLAVAALMGVWWMSEALPLAVTSLLPLVLYPVLGIMKTSQAAPNYTHHLVFLFMGGFIIAIALQEWQLHRRFALHTIALIGNNPRKIILAFMVATALLSMWISNTATTIMMLPIGLAVIRQLQNKSSEADPERNRFGTILMLGIAYSASIGGIATLIGTPPNVVFSGIYSKYFPQLPEVSFMKWMIMAFPVSVLIFLFMWFYLTRVALRKKDLPPMLDRDMFREQIRELGGITAPQRWVMIIFLVTALLWMFRADIKIGGFVLPGWPHLFGLAGRIQDSTIAIGMAVLLFMIPVKGDEERKTILHWKNLLQLPWDILILFGGGFALADGIQKSGLADYLGRHLEFVGHLPLFPMLFLIALSAALLTEFTSNTAVATTILPILAALATNLRIDPILIMVPATVATSCAFMLPVATPPNAIVFGSRYIPIQKMVRIGSVLIVASALIASVFFYLFFHLSGF